tara:strand:- start:36916 stop:38058 length:1143 start_codon:yes stop_codon:yes gene_type:complete
MIHPSEPNPFLPVGATSLAETDGPSERPRTVLVLGGGGMRGMAHIGVLKAIEEAGIQVDAVVGTSIGALIGAMYAGGLSVAEIEPFARQLKKDDYFKLSTLRILLKGHRTPSLYQGQRFHDSLEKVLPVRSFADMKIPFYCNAVSLETGGSVFWGSTGFDDVDVIDAVYSSCALPAVFEPFEHGGNHYIDGGIADPVPLRFAKTLSPELLLAVDLTVKGTYKSYGYKKRAFGTLFRSFEIAEEVLVEHMLHLHAGPGVVLIQPKVGHLHRFDFEDVSEVIEAGHMEGRAVLTSNVATRDLVSQDIVEGMACPAVPRDYVTLHIDPARCIGCGMCQAVCETDGFWAQGGLASVRKQRNYDCTRDHACARNCPTNAIRLGNL